MRVLVMFEGRDAAGKGAIKRIAQYHLHNPMHRWKLSDTDLQSITRWEDYSRAEDATFATTDT